MILGNPFSDIRAPFVAIMLTLVPARLDGQDAARTGATNEVEQFRPNPAAQDVPPVPAETGAAFEHITFTGVTRFSEDELRALLSEQIGGLKKGGLTPALADDTAFFLAVHYRKNGYSQVEVTEEIKGGNLILHVKEGPLTEITEIEFDGNKSIDGETLRKYLLGATTERFSRFEKTIPYIEGDILTGVERIRGLYLSEGFLKSDVSKPEITISAGGAKARIKVSIQEGTQYHIGTPEISGDVLFLRRSSTAKGAPTDLLGKLSSYAGKPYTPTQVVNMRRAVVYYYKSRGYYDTKVTAASDPSKARDGMVPVSFHVESGPLYRFDGVAIEGLERLRESFLQRRFGKLNGQIYSPEKLDTVFRRMMRTGLFNRLQVESEPTGDHQILIRLNVEEAKARELGFSLGYGTFEGPFVGVSAAERNLYGTGRPIEARIEYSQRTSKGEALFQDPWFLESNFQLRVRAFALNTDFEGYSKFEAGSEVAFSRDLTEHLEATAFILARKVNVTDSGVDPTDLGPTHYFVNSLGASLTWDYRDSLLNPRRGWILTASADYSTHAIGSDLNFVRGTYRFSYYFPIGDRMLLAIGARGGVIHPLNHSGDFPIDERFFNGGSRSVRSFAERDLGPKDRYGFPIGGQNFTTYNLEYVFPIVGDLEGAAFVDAGSVGRKATDGLGDLRYGIGGGLRYKLPVGPLRLDYGWNPAPRANESSGAFHFSFGFAF